MCKGTHYENFGAKWQVMEGRKIQNMGFSLLIASAGPAYPSGPWPPLCAMSWGHADTWCVQAGMGGVGVEWGGADLSPSQRIQ